MMTDESYAVDPGTRPRAPLSETTISTFSSPNQDCAVRSFISHAYPISTSSPEIRVIDLQRSNDFEDPLVGTFRTVSLAPESSPHFTALSYVWGTSQPTQRMTIDLGVGELPITRNCQDALKRIRQLYGDTTIWVDSICIDQNCQTERSHQVSLMGGVYSRADKVYVWLGQGTSGIQRALEYSKYAASFVYLPLGPEATRDHHSVWQRVKLQLKVIPPFVDLKGMCDYWRWKEIKRSYRAADWEELLETPWFSRIWTFQEIVLATDAIILCGPTTLSWDTFARGYRGLRCLLNHENNPWMSDGVRYDRRTVQHWGRRLVHMLFQTKTLGSQECRPCGSLALERILFLWIRVNKRGLNCNDCLAYGGASDSSILWRQKPYVDICNRHLQYLGLTVTHIVAYFLYCVVLVPLVKSFYTRTASYADGVRISCSFGLFLILVIMFLLLSKLPRTGDFTGDLDAKGSEQRINAELLLAIVETLSYRQAKESKDMSYALYGVLGGFGVKLSTLDYSKSQAQIYHELCLDLMAFQPFAINLLIYANTVQQGQVYMESRAEKIPTWVPDWTRLEVNQFISFGTSDIPNVYYATTWRDATFTRFGADKRAIFVPRHWEGAIAFCMKRLQMVSEMVPRLPTRKYPVITSIEVFSEWVNALRKVVPEYPAIPAEHSFRQYCFYCQCWRKSCSCPAGEAAIHPAIIYLFLKQRRNLPEKDDDLLRVRKIYDIFVQEEQVEATGPRETTPQDAQDILTSLLEQDLFQFFVEIINGQAKSGSTWFITTGGYLGCGTGSVRPGDRLALVAGVAAPMVLRSMDPDKSDWFDSQYMAVCSAYVLGWMYGEVFKRETMKEIHII